MIKFIQDINKTGARDKVQVGTNTFQVSDLDITTQTQAGIPPVQVPNKRPDREVIALFQAKVQECKEAFTKFLAELESASVISASLGSQTRTKFNIELVNKNGARINAVINISYSVNTRTNEYSLDHENIKVNIPSGEFSGNYTITKNELPKAILDGIKTYMSSTKNPFNVRLENGDPADAKATSRLKTTFAKLTNAA